MLLMEARIEQTRGLSIGARPQQERGKQGVKAAVTEIGNQR